VTDLDSRAFRFVCDSSIFEYWKIVSLICVVEVSNES